MGNLRPILSEIKNPVFIIDSESRKICEANQSVFSACKLFDPIGERFDSVVYQHEELSETSIVYFNREWLHMNQEPFYWEGKPYLKVVLHQNPAIPDQETLLIVRNMIAVLANRLRSPITGMQGYLDIVRDAVEKKSERMIEKINAGLDQLIEIIDELEFLHNAKEGTNPEHLRQFINPELIIREILFSYPGEIRNRIKILRPESQFIYKANSRELKQILTYLIDNAVDHSTAKDQDIIIDLRSVRSIKISNKGKPIPAPVREKLYFPFITTKADSMGIGLTIAQLLAKRQDGNIFLIENSSETNITFVFCLPPGSDMSVV